MNMRLSILSLIIMLTGCVTVRDKSGNVLYKPESSPTEAAAPTVTARPLAEVLGTINYTRGTTPTKEQLTRLIQECVLARLAQSKGPHGIPETCTIRFEAQKAYKPNAAASAEFEVIEGDAYMAASIASQAVNYYRNALKYYYEVQRPNDRMTNEVRLKLKTAELVEPTRQMDQLVQKTGRVSDPSLRDCAQSIGSISPTHSNETVSEAFDNMDRVSRAWSPNCRKFTVVQREGVDLLESLTDLQKAPRCRRLVSQVPWKKAEEQEFMKRFSQHCEDKTRPWTFEIREALSESVGKNLQARADNGDPDAAIQIGVGRLRAGQYEKALKMFMVAAQKGNTLAPVGVAAVHVATNGRGNGGKQALPWLKKSAEAGNPNGMWMIGWAYDYAVGTSRNEQLARQWYDRARKAGYLGNRLAMNSDEYAILSKLFSATPETQTAKQQAIEEGLSNSIRWSAESATRKADYCQQRCQSACSQGEFVESCTKCKRSCQATH